jgi:hypothetical protein
MNTRPAWGLLTCGAIVIIILFFSPIWLKQFTGYLEEEEEDAPFPDAFFQLSNQAQADYLSLYETNDQMAIDLVAARLAPPVDVEDENLPATDPNPALVQVLLTGNFVAVDSMRAASGTATLYRLSDGRTIARLENLNAISGPDLRVLLSAFSRPQSREELDQLRQYEIDLGALRGNVGNQNYFITDPAFNIENYAEGSVVLLSERYDLVFSYAPLTPPEVGFSQ